MKPAIVILVMLMTVPALGAGAECDRAADLYNQAISENLDAKESIGFLNRALDDCPGYFPAHLALGLWYAHQGQTDKALESFKDAEAFAANPREKAQALIQLGLLTQEQGRDHYAAALCYFDKACQADPAPDHFAHRLALEKEMASGVMSKEQIVDVLKTKKDKFNIKPKVELRVNFAYDSDRLTAEGMAQADELGRALTEACFKNCRFVLIGHTDKQGPAEYNQGLSQRRAKAIRDYLEDHFPGVKGRTSSQGKGENELLYPGDSEDEHAMNRRVEVVVEQ